jgi:hypothetical protein
MAPDEFDLIVIGSGPAGEKGAAQGAYFGQRVAGARGHVPEIAAVGESKESCRRWVSPTASDRRTIRLMRADFFIQSVFNYPTLGEAYKYAAYDGLGNLARAQPPRVRHRDARPGDRDSEDEWP